MLYPELHDIQYEIATDAARYKVICAGRRSGKSVLARMLLYKWAMDTPGRYWIVSPTYKQAKAIHWQEMIKELPKEWVLKKNEVELSMVIRTSKKNQNSIIELRGAENPDSLRGVSLGGLVIDEVASIRNWNWLWNEVLQATLIDKEAPAVFISTPKGFNAFYDLYRRGVEDQVEYKSWKFTSYDNPYISRDEIEKKRVTMMPDTFAQEYLADFKKYTGLVYKEFERKHHVVTPFDVPDTWKIYRSMDFGSTNPTVCLWIAVDEKDNWFIVDEHYRAGQTIDFHAGVINAHPLSQRVIQTYGDPSGAQWIEEFNQRGIHITPANKETGTNLSNWVLTGIEKVRTRMKLVPGRNCPYPGQEERRQEGYPSLFVFEKCMETIQEFETYRWKERKETEAEDLNELDVPEKANDHACDSMRYFAVSYRKMDYHFDEVNREDDDKWKIG